MKNNIYNFPQLLGESQFIYMQEILRILNANSTRNKSKENYMTKMQGGEFTVPIDITYQAKSLYKDSIDKIVSTNKTFSQIRTKQFHNL